MEMATDNQKLVRQRIDLSVAREISLTASQQTLAVEMHLTGLNAKSEPPSELAAEFDKKFGALPQEAIQWIFSQWRDMSPFWPAISDLKELLRQWRNEQEFLRQRAEAREIREARETGGLVEFTDIVSQLKTIAKAMPEPETSQRVRDMRRREVSAETPAVQLTAEQIKARRAAELAEIQRYEEKA